VPFRETRIRNIDHSILVTIAQFWKMDEDCGLRGSARVCPGQQSGGRKRAVDRAGIGGDVTRLGTFGLRVHRREYRHTCLSNRLGQ
jgi:hypothetical protein